VTRDQVRAAASACWPRLGVKVWKEKLLDAVSDRCVRLCRRDPRDSAEAEQALFEQLDDALDRARAGQRVSLNVRTAHWYQDVVQQPDEFDGYCTALARPAAEAIRELVAGAGLPLPPRVVWLTHAAGRLPGLAKAVHQHSSEGTAIDVLAPGAVAHAAAGLVSRWLSGELPRQHLDTTLPLPPLAQTEATKAGKRG
jgi:glyoxylase-like metal-dependent hydrolase (beta-lactamase superfamily II)